MPPALLPAVLSASARAQAPLQSVLDGRGDAGARILEITWVLLAGGGAIFLAVLVVLGLALAGPPAWRARLARRAWIVGAGFAFPLVTLSMLLVYTLGAAAGMGEARRAPAAVRIEVTGELWWWRVRYLDAAGATLLETANEIHIPAAAPVELELRSADVIHSFWVPSLAGKMDMIPGRVNRLRLRAREPGVFRGQCAEFCGAQHAKMALHVVARPAEEFAGWLQARQRVAAPAASPLLSRGSAVFEHRRCGVCHAIRGTAAGGTLGPDLTHVGSRLSLGAGTLPGGREPLAAWITRTQHVKPGSRMPAYPGLTGADLEALVSYLESLR